MTRDEHMTWCKKRANEYLAKGDVANAVASMMSDLTKHPETEGLVNGPLGMLGLMAAASGDQREADRYINGFA